MSVPTFLVLALGLACAWSWLAAAGALTAHARLSLAPDRPGYWIGALIVSIVPVPLGAVVAMVLPGGHSPAAFLGAQPLAAPEPALFLVLHGGTGPAPSVSLGDDLAVLALMLVAGGALVRLAATLRRDRRIGTLVAHAAPASPELSDGLLPEAARACGVRLRISEGAPSAFAHGRRCIVLPRPLLTQMTMDRLALITAHEWAHLERGDPVLQRRVRLLRAGLWILPGLRALERALEVSAELACDGAVLAGAPAHTRRTYAATLLEALRFQVRTVNAAAGPVLPHLPAAFSPHHLRSEKMRLHRILKGHGPQRKARGRLAGGLGLSLVALASLASAQVLAEAEGGPSFAAPFFVEGAKISSAFGMRRHPITGRMAKHRGVDLVAPLGTPIAAPAAGTVTRADHAKGYGNLVDLDHGNGLQTRYAQLDSFAVAPGDRVETGQIFARVGSSGRSTGPHLHLEVLRDGQAVDPEEVFDLSAFARRKGQ